MIEWLNRCADEKRVSEILAEQRRKEAAEHAARAKAEWETRNELEKKIDACYLGTRRQAFYGTYEEFQAYTSSKELWSLSVFQQHQQLHANALQQIANQQQGIQQFSGRGGILGGIFGGIFGPCGL